MGILEKIADIENEVIHFNFYNNNYFQIVTILK